MANVYIDLHFRQTFINSELDSDQIEEFKEMFFDPDPYFMSDDVNDNINFVVQKEEVQLLDYGENTNEEGFAFFWREFDYRLHLTVNNDNVDTLKKNLEQEDALDQTDDEFSPIGFARHLLGSWEYEIVNDEMISFDKESVGGELQIIS
jgi:Mlc titration factor MtfA (ptsG expression regulator)